MKNLIKILLTCFVFQGSAALAQNKKFVTGGTIEFERTENMFAMIKKKVTIDHPENKQYYEQYQKSEPQFLKYQSTLVFNTQNSLFTPITGKPIPWFYDEPIADQLNIVYSDFSTGMTTTQKEFYERTYLIKDTLRKIKWKITDETRTVAGYNCRRANGIMLDSIYVVAFYTENIHVSGGPESFNGLPGMILQVVLPHDNLSWIATKITLDPIDEKKIVPPKKGTVINYKKLFDVLWESRGNKGEIGRYFIKGLAL